MFLFQFNTEYQPQRFVLNVKSPEESLRQAAESALRHVVGDNSLDQALTVGRESIGDQVKERIQSYLIYMKLELLLKLLMYKAQILRLLLKMHLMILLLLEKTKKDIKMKHKDMHLQLFQKQEVKLKQEFKRQRDIS